MKLRHTEFNRGVPRQALEAGIVFLCGPDEAGASAAAAKIVAALPEPGERVELSGADLKRDPALLGDEARSGSLFGDKRHILVRAQGDDAHDAVRALIETSEAGAGAAAPVIIVATSATDKARTAKLLEKRADGLVVMFYQPDPGSVAAAVRAMADAAGLRLGGDLAERIARAARLDVRLAQSEITKLALYVDADPQRPRPATPQDYEAIGASSEDDAMAPLVNAVLGGDTSELSAQLARMREQDINPVGLLLAIERRAAQLAQIAARIGPGGSIDRLSRGEEAQLGIFFREKAAIARQHACWSRPVARSSSETRLDRLIPRLVALHRQLLTNSSSAELLLAQDLTEIARFASRR
ncbi:MAG: DNA polymerase III subunit delta [Erythrobacter sp.]|nr:DNA polymerase III subunit delta [Erythrobacter sp.]